MSIHTLKRLLAWGAALVALALPITAAAQEPATPVDRSFSVQLYEPALGHDPLFTIESARTVGHLSVTAGLLLGFQANPFSVYLCRPGTYDPEQNTCDLDRDNSTDVVTAQLQADLFATLSIIDMVQIGLAVPILLYQGGDGLASLDGPPLGGATNLGDLRLHVKWTAPFGLGSGDADGFGLAIAPSISFPTGNAIVSDNFMGDGTVTVHVQVLGEYRWRSLQVGARVGYRWREDSVIYSTVIGDHLTYGVGAAYSFDLPRPGYAIRPMVELWGANGFSTELDQNPLEVDVGAQVTLANDFNITLGAGAGLVAAVGVPSYRVLAGFLWAPRRLDSDRDGIPDSEDQCPNEREDSDGYADTDGCPEADYDEDGIDDEQDRCPADPEDFDRFQDDDGCPDIDNDNDGINDGYDSCTNEAEDFDGYADEDGCPDLDHDHDNINAPQDHCPFEAEDTDGFADEDGCPEADYDGDGLLDDQGDLCPESPEDFDGFEDDDGCADTDNDLDMIPDSADRCPTRPESWNDEDDEDGCPDGRSFVTITGGQFRLAAPLEFAAGGRQLTGRASASLLNIVAAILRLQPDMRLRISVTASDEPLARGRAESIRHALTERRIDAARLETAAQAGSATRVELNIILPEGAEPVEPEPAPAGGDEGVGPAGSTPPAEGAAPAGEGEVMSFD